MTSRHHQHRHRAICLLALSAIFVGSALTLSAAGQGRASRRTGTIDGRVIDDDGQPLEGMTVVCVSANSHVQRLVLTDTEGNFSFPGLAPTVYRLGIYSTVYTLREQEGGEGIPVRIGDTRTLTLSKGGVITGRVTNAAGEPMVEVQVLAIRVRDGAGNPMRVSGTAGYQITDDRGIYRHFGLPAGTYIVVANPTNGYLLSENAYDQRIPTYFPTTNREGAAEINVQPGAEVGGIDIRYRDIRAHIVSGTIEGATGSGAQDDYNVQVELRTAGVAQVLGWAFGRYRDGVRIFAINGVPDGEYELSVQGMVASDQMVISPPRRITVRGADITGVKLIAGPLGSIAGRFTVVAATSMTECARSGVDKEPAPEEVMIRSLRDERVTTAEPYQSVGARFGGTVGANGEFIVKRLRSGPQWIAVDLPGEDWYVTSVTMPGPTASQKTIDLGRTALMLKAGERATGVSVTAATGAAQLSGKIPEERARRGRWRVHLVPADASQADNTLVYYETGTDEDGSFTLRHLAPGKYWMLVREWPEDLSVEIPMRRTAWNASERAKLRREADATKQEIELKACQKVSDFVVMPISSPVKVK